MQIRELHLFSNAFKVILCKVIALGRYRGKHIVKMSGNYLIFCLVLKYGESNAMRSALKHMADASDCALKAVIMLPLQVMQL